MKPVYGWIIVGLLLATLVIAGMYFERRRMRRYWERPCAGRSWRRSFPDSAAPGIRAFLEVFSEAFGFSARHLLKFRPDDPVMDVYRTLYPPKTAMVDGMELESFVMLIKTNYGTDLDRIWGLDLTLGEVFALTRTRAHRD